MILQQSTQDRRAYLIKARRYARARYRHWRDDPDYRYAHCSFAAARALEDTERQFPDLGTFGVEGHSWTTYHGVNYLNTGDTYDATILFRSDSERFWIGSWGDFVEHNERLFR
jgi:hypothetical protein